MSTKLRDLDDELGAAFRSADADAPGPEAKAALLATLGLGAVAAGAAAGTAGATAAAGGSTVAAAKTAGTFLALKWVIVSAVLVSGAAATVHVVTAPPVASAVVVSGTPATTPAIVATAAPRPRDVIPPPAPAPPAAPEPVAAARAPIDVADLPTSAPIAAPPVTVAAAAAPVPAASAMVTTTATTVERSGSSTPAVAPAPAPVVAEHERELAPPAARRATVADEIAKLDEARALLRAGRGADAAAAIADYRRAFPAGTLAEEAAVLEIESLASAGQRDRATALAARFVAAHPSSPLLHRVQRATGHGSPP